VHFSDKRAIVILLVGGAEVRSIRLAPISRRSKPPSIASPAAGARVRVPHPNREPDSLI
jgi:hypothetical protein